MQEMGEILAPVAVMAEGPHDSDGDGTPQWTVAKIDDNGDDVGAIHRFSSEQSARLFATQLARTLRLELVDEITPL
jgi:hypothetical protein